MNKISKKRDWVPLLLLIALTLWYGLSFLGVPRLVGSWHITDGFWFFLALLLLVVLLVGIYALWKGFVWGNWQILILLCIWLYIQYIAHWQRFIIPPSLERIRSYYASFPYWYLISKSSTRIVPDGYHTIMYFLMIILFFLVLVRVIRDVLGAKKSSQ